MADLHEIPPQDVKLSSRHQSTSPSVFESLASGAVGGICLVLAGHPLDLLKVRLQTNNQPISTTRLLGSLIRREGLAGIYRGVSAPLIGVAPIFAISIWGYDTGKTLAATFIVPGAPIDSIRVAAIGSALAAIPTSILQVPGDRIKLRLQVSQARKHTNPFTETCRIWNEGGFRSLYRGYTITLAREIPGTAIYFSNYTFTKRFTFDHLTLKGVSSDSASALSVLLAGGLAGTLNGLITLPVDTIKSRFQAAPPGQYDSARHVAKDLLQKEGFRALFRGIGPVLLRAFPANAACFGGIEIVRYFFCK